MLPLAILALGFAVIAPALWSGWSGDDAFYSALRGMLRVEHASLGQAIWHAMAIWTLGNGRVYPLHIVETYLIFYAFTNLVAYKVFLITTTLVAVELFRRCVAAYGTTDFGNLCALVVVTLFSERGYHDAILAYNGATQLVAIVMLASLLALRRALTGRGSLVVPVVLYAAAALTYEDAYALCLLYPAIALATGRPARTAARIGLPFVAVAVVLTALSLSLRHLADLAPGSLYSSNLDPAAVARTAYYQVTSALPLSYWIFDPSRIFSRSSAADFLRNTPISPIVLVAAAAVGVAALRPAWDALRVRAAAAIGALLLVLPALPISIASKYQHELKLGLGYLPVFFQVFGTALLAGAAIVLLLRRYPAPGARAAVAILLACCAAMTQAANVRVVREGMGSSAARASLERRLSGGLVARVHDGQAIAVAATFDWIDYDDAGPDGISTRGLFAMYGDRIVQLVPIGESSAAYALRYDRRLQQWFLVSVRHGD